MKRILDGSKMILDVGCGQASPLRFVEDSYKVGLDHFRPYILKSKSAAIHNAYVLADASHLPFRSKSFDCAVAIEVIEHLGKQDGLRMIKQMEDVTQRKILLTTPNGFFNALAGPDALNPEEKHISGWFVSEFRKLGFKVYGLNGFKLLYKAAPGKVVLKFRPQALFAFLASISCLFVYFFPSLAFQLFSIKICSAKRETQSYMA